MGKRYGLTSPSVGEPVKSSRSRSKARLSATSSSRHLAWPSANGESDTSEYLNVAERWWRALQPWLEQCGYLLRARYREDWIPSWEKKGFFTKLHVPEDMIELPVRFKYWNPGITPAHFTV